jgi:hypothetical protein
MSTKIYQSKYKDVSALTLESDALSVQFLPDYGAKLASLVYKKTGREFMVQDKSTAYKVLEYDGDYGAAECSGFDDMFPTIDRMFYTDYPWKGIDIPDHGEVCSLRWKAEINDDMVYMSVYGVRFPYKLEKWISFKDSNHLSIKYKATNLSAFDMDFLWAAHAMINVEEGGQIFVPYEEGSPVTTVFSADPAFGKYDDKIKWPVAMRRDGKLERLDLTSEKKPDGNTYKVYFDDKIPEGWCAYKYNSDNTILKFMFPTETVPYFCIWVNNGCFHDLHNIAMEVCTGAYDRPDAAKVRGQNSVLKADSEYAWYLDIVVE